MRRVRFSLWGIRFSLTFWFAAAFAVYTLYSVDSLYVIGAMLIHELSHILMIALFGGAVEKIHLGLTEVNIRTELAGIAPNRRLLIALAGPAANILTSAAVYIVNPVFAASNLMIGVFQLLPVVSLDGGTILEIMLKGRSPAFKKVLSFVISFAVLFLGIMVLLVSKYNFSLLIVGVYLLFVTVTNG